MMHEEREPEGKSQKFVVLRRRESRNYVLGAALSMMADNIEHVLTYWVLWVTFESPALVGFQIVSHWLPFFLFSVYAGALAERFDCRRIIQIAQGLFMAVSVAWGVLFITGTLELWHACVLLVLHGLAGCIWMPAEQLMLYDFAGPKDLPSAVRINSTFRSLGFLIGPVVGSALLVAVGSSYGMFINALLYIPLTVFLWRTKVTGHRRERPRVAETKLSFREAFGVFSTVRANPKIFSMILLTALAGMTIGATMQNAMPEFASRLGAGSEGDFTYGILLVANGIGGVVGGFLLEATGRVPATVKTAVISAIVLGITTIGFALSGNYLLSVLALIVGGFARITSESTEMSIIQLEAPEHERGRIIGAYTMFGPGMMTFSGVTIAVLGSIAGIAGAVVVSGIILTVGSCLVGLWVWRKGIS
ncbi:MFS transporter [Leucobacter sp. UCMA 4100]|uniref:MFS transporter n=1 Tax=Leucobacter sp. UCMA 4100 TaxID=2810534 RepID=UPI0022EA3537|nr:MFS transporter [Leucobacter sp. UCMA 4100]MDA3147319.1 MFS transporter [Leucobacter sp. UCMA 4100]